MKTRQVWLFVLGIGLVASLIGVAVLASKVSSLNEDRDSANDLVSEAEGETASVLADLEEVEKKLKKARRSLRNALAATPAPTGDLLEQLQNGTAVPVDGLSADLPREFWTCTRWQGDECHSLKDEVVFKNDTQVGSAVTCLFSIEYENGATTSFTWSSDYVPQGGGTDTQMLYFYSDYSSAIALLGPPDDCYRGAARYTSGIGD